MKLDLPEKLGILPLIVILLTVPGGTILTALILVAYLFRKKRDTNGKDTKNIPSREAPISTSEIEVETAGDLDIYP